MIGCRLRGNFYPLACRITGRQIALVSNSVSKDKLSKFLDYCSPDIKIETVDFNFQTGQLDLNDLRNKISRNIACIYFENPSYLGIIEQQGNQISDIAHERDALVLVGVDPFP